MSEEPVRLSAWVHGAVQGVGFRWWTRSRALELGLVGYARNHSDGRVHVVAEGQRTAGEKLLELLRSGEASESSQAVGQVRQGLFGRVPGRVDLVVESWEPARGDMTGFEER
ncbi:acylphosphatase [Nocardia alba]|uniref:Acylphosphatase n=1 Tax=Nocardia alba TaxID=225051 RepID=A0A4R1FZN3_9NOCA|nr:acylphosphatase [Nocardia alba]TCJ99229.1 acylphosphatase [Nocardia alba]